MTIQSEVQKLSTDDMVYLYELDTTAIGGTTIFRFTNSSGSSGHVTFGGHQYVAIDMLADGFAWDGQGAFPRPKIQIANANGLLTSSIIELGDLVGSDFRRIRTFRQFLDDGSNPDTDEVMPIDYYSVEQKTNQNKLFVEWSLSSIIDQSGRMLPGRLILRDICPFTYRLYKADTDSFDYTKAVCPYGNGLGGSGTDYFDENDDTTTKANDICSKRIDGCKARFGEKAQLPFGGFPGVQRKRSY